MSKLHRTLTFAAAAALLTAPQARAQSKTVAGPSRAPASAAAPASAFVGQWQLNVAKSDFGPMAAQAPTAVTMTVTRTGDLLTVAQAVSMSGQSQTVSTDYRLTGRDTTTNAPDGLPVTSNASMSDTSVTITAKLQRQGMDITSDSRWSLSSDRKVLTIAQSTQTPMGGAKVSMVFDRMP